MHDEGVQGSSEASDSPVAVRGSPVATATMKMTARHTGALRGSGGVVTVWSRVCAWVHVFLQTRDKALAYALSGWSAMADKVMSGGGNGETGRLTVGGVEEGW